MTDNEIRKILAERKRQARKQEQRANIREAIEDIVGWISLFGICFLLSVIG